MHSAILVGDWRVGKPLGVGTFSEVVQGTHHAATHIHSGRVAAVKVGRTKEGSRMLAHESDVLKQLASCACSAYSDVPKRIEAREDAVRPFIAMEELGKTLNSLRNEQAFSPLTIALLGMKLVAAYNSLHSFDFLHRDVKPDNLAVSKDPSDARIYLLDFGVATKYKVQGMHVKYGEEGDFAGSRVFCSRNVLRGVRPARRDDMTALGYVLVYFVSKDLPWMRINSRDLETSAEHFNRKVETTPLGLCRGLAPEFREYLDYCEALLFHEKPDYEYLERLFRKLAVQLGFCGVWEYDWVVKNCPKRRKHRSRHCKVSVKTMLRHINSVEPSPGERLEELVTACSPGDCKPMREGSSALVFGERKSLSPLCVFAQAPCDEVVTPLLPNHLNIETVRHKLKQLM